jgi:glucose/arabinose dehydrogenase
MKKKLLLLSLCAAAAVPVVPAAFGVGTSNWSHTSEADFKAGTFENVVATNLGDLKLSRHVRMLLQQNPQVSSVNAMVQAPDGTIYAGTGPHGQILKISGDDVTELATIEGATHVFALAMDKDGGLLIGTAGESGRVLKMPKPGEKPAELFKADGVQYVWAVAQTDDGKVYAATGPNGQLFEISGPGQNR